MNKYENEINMLKLEIKTLNNKMDELIKICGKMDNHITNVENVYTIVRKPFSYITTNINKMIGNEKNNELPEFKLIKNNTEW
jgi:hypothetical protein